MPLEVKKLRAEFSTLKTEAEALFTKRTTDNREYTAEEKTEQEKRFARMEAIKTLIDEDAKFAALALADGKVELTKEPEGKEEFDAHVKSIQIMDKGKVDKAEFNKAISRWAATGEMERKFATITTATQSGILMPTDILQPIAPSYSNSFRDAINIVGYAPALLSTTNTDIKKVPVLSGAAGGKVTETASSETENAPTLTGSITLTPDTYQSGSVYFSNMALLAPDFNMEQEILPVLAFSKEQALENQICTSLAADAGITQVVDLVAGALTYAKLVDLNRALPRRYDNLKAIVLDSTVYAAAEKLVDTTGQPILIRDPQNQTLLRFAGTPVLRADGFADYGASDGQVIGCVMSLLGFRLRDAANPSVMRYTQVPAKPNQTGFNLFAYHAFGWDPAAVAKLKS